jgi:tetratricopeptide (TPR) repeat protein
MGRKWNISWKAGTLAGLILWGCGIVAAQGYGSGQGSQSQPPAQPADKPKTPDTAPLTLDATPPVSAEEDAAFKAFQAVSTDDPAKKIEAGEAFLKKYPESRYRGPVYGALTYASVANNQIDKMQEYGEKDIALVPNDVSVLAVMAQTLPRSLHSNTPEPEKLLAKAEQYSKQAIEITPTLPKPPNMTDETFAMAKNQTLAMAHGGLGLVYVRRQKYAEAIPELQQAVKIDPKPDPVNYYLLGVANKNTSHFDDAVAAFNQCAAMPGVMQATCKSNAEDAKKRAATELSAPK